MRQICRLKSHHCAAVDGSCGLAPMVILSDLVLMLSPLPPSFLSRVWTTSPLLCTIMSPTSCSSLIFCFDPTSDFFQYLLEAGWAAEGKVIGVTQPRRVAAISVSCSSPVSFHCKKHGAAMKVACSKFDDVHLSHADR